MSVSDRWHTKQPRKIKDPATGELVPVLQCRQHRMWPSAEHMEGDRWQVRYRDEHGKQRSQNFVRKTGDDPEECADAFDKKTGAEINSDSFIDPALGKTHFKKFAEEVLENRTLDSGTRIKMRERLKKHVYPAIGHQELRALSRRPSLVQNLVRRMEKTLGPATIQTIMAHVGVVFTAAIEDGMIGKNPMNSKLVVLPKVVKKKVVPWTDEQVMAMRAELPARYAAMVDVGAGMGLRQGEILGLSPDDIDWVSGIVHVRRQVKVQGKHLMFHLPKGDKERDVPLTPGVERVLRRHQREHPPVAVTLPWAELDGDPLEVRLFFTPTPEMSRRRPGAGGAIHREVFNRDVWRPALERVGIVAPPLPGEKRKAAREHGMHALRHYFASRLLTKGEAIQAVSKWMGHWSPTITLTIYAHLMPESETRMRELLDAALYPDSEASAQNVPSEDQPEE